MVGLTDAMAYFEKINPSFACPAYTNPADHFLDLITTTSQHLSASSSSSSSSSSSAAAKKSGSTPSTVIVNYFESNVKTKVITEAKSIPKGVNVRSTISYRPSSIVTAPFTKQMRELLLRELKLNFRDPQKIMAKAANAVVMALLVGAMYFHVDQEYVPPFAYIALAITSMSAMVSLPSFFADRLMLNLERTDRLYTTLPYYIVNSGVGLLVSIMANAVFGTIVWGMVGIGWQYYFKFFLITFIIFFATDGLIVLISACCRTLEQAMATFNMTIGIFLLFNGFSANTKTTPPWLSWICYMSPLYYSMEMFLDALYENSPLWVSTGQLFGMRKHVFWTDFFICLSIGCAGRFLAFFAMKHLNKIER